MNAYTDKLKIAVVGLSPGAGAGFVSAGLAAAFAGIKDCRPALLELGGQRLYDSLGMDKHFAGREFIRFFGLISKGRSIRGLSNDLAGINWVLKAPGEGREALDIIKMLRMVNNVCGNVIVSKISADPGEELREILKDMDRILVVIDPMPSMMLAGHDALCRLRSSELPLIYAVNKMNGGVSRRELLNYLQLKKAFYIPMVPPETLYGAEYSCRFPFDLPEVKNIIEPILEEMAREMLSFQRERATVTYL
ncbi:hypothetical protein MASR2M70_04460 [Bacillota bacterium]